MNKMNRWRRMRPTREQKKGETKGKKEKVKRRKKIMIEKGLERGQ